MPASPANNRTHQFSDSSRPPNAAKRLARPSTRNTRPNNRMSAISERPGCTIMISPNRIQRTPRHNVVHQKRDRMFENIGTPNHDETARVKGGGSANPITEAISPESRNSKSPARENAREFDGVLLVRRAVDRGAAQVYR